MSDEQQSSSGLSSHELAEERTDWAEDRTIMANERTFAGWMRTGLACVGIGIGFNALFGKLEPGWAARAIASVFILAGLVLFWLARRSACAVQERMNAHAAAPLAARHLNVVAGLMGVGAFALLIGIWFIRVPE